MNVVWKRPDGFHGASPEDFVVVDVASKSRLWLHRTDNENYPFRVSGGWQDEKETRRLNLLVNLLAQADATWTDHLPKAYEHSESEDGATYLAELTSWLTELTGHLKGDTWEVAIMGEALAEVKRRVESCGETVRGLRNGD